MKMHPASHVSASWQQWPASVAEEMRDVVANDNMSAAQAIQVAREVRAWADSKVGPQWAAQQRFARWHAARLMQEHRPRAVLKGGTDDPL